MENARLNFSNLYLRRIISGPSANQLEIIRGDNSTRLGQTAVNNWALYDGVGPDAEVVAHAKGMHMNAAGWYISFTMVFQNERFKESTLEVMGVMAQKQGEWAIVGGTGAFSMARGVIERKFHSDITNGEMQELNIDAFCRMKNIELPAPTKVGPWGTTGGSLQEIEGKPQRLETVTIWSGSNVDGISFTYIGEDGQVHTAGRWGDDFHYSTSTIKFGPSEFVKEISVATLDDYIVELLIITDVATYGPYGARRNQPANRYTAPADKTIVGFFVNSDRHIRSIGLYAA